MPLFASVSVIARHSGLLNNLTNLTSEQAERLAKVGIFRLIADRQEQVCVGSRQLQMLPKQKAAAYIRGGGKKEAAAF